MSYINKGDLLMLDEKLKVIAASSDYTELYYDLEAREMARYGLDYGVARGVVKVILPDGKESKVELRRIKMISSVDDQIQMSLFQ